MGKSKKVIVILFGVMICFILNGCSQLDKVEQAFNKYTDMWIAKDFEGMYKNLSSESKNYVTEQEFIDRYNNIYNAIGANNIYRKKWRYC